MTPQQAAALQAIARAVLAAIESTSNPVGMPGGYLYAGMMTQGCTLEQFEQIMAGLVSARFVLKHGDCYTILDRGRAFLHTEKAAA